MNQYFIFSDSINNDFWGKVSYSNKAMYCIINVGEKAMLKRKAL